MTGVRPLLIGDIGFGELVVIAFVAVIVFGPDKLSVLAKQAGQMARKVRDFANSARDELRNELGEEYADLELRDLDPRTIVRKHIIEAMEEGEEEERRRPSGQRPLAADERPPYDAEST
jgi:sec-independent protein translocase protein TatB